MQLKGLVRFFAIALILICIYQLSFTWFVRNHENKMEEKAAAWVKANYPTAQVKYPGNATFQKLYQDTLDVIRESRLQRLLDSTKNDKIYLGLVSYKTSKEKELMLGLDLQGGISVTMEVGIDELLKALANHTKDTAFNAAVAKAVQQKANSDANLIDLFNEQYKASGQKTPLAQFFAAKSGGKIKYNSSDGEVLSYLRSQASSAFTNTYNILQTRIDRFGVASPNINKDESKNIITVELAGAKDKERVRKYLQSTANLQFFELYNLNDVYPSWKAAEQVLSKTLAGKPAIDTTGKDSSGVKDSLKNTASGKAMSQKDSFPMSSIVGLIEPRMDPKTKQYIFDAAVGRVLARDTATLNAYLNYDYIKRNFPDNLRFAYGKPEVKEAEDQGVLLVYALKTMPNGTAPLEGDHIEGAKVEFNNNKVIIEMRMDPAGTKIWGDITTKAAPDEAKRKPAQPIAIVLDEFVYSAPFVQSPITNGVSQISGNYSLTEAQDLARILESGKLPAPAKIVQENVIGPTLGEEALQGGSLAFLISFIVIFALMLVYYNTAGWVANVALILNIFFTLGVLSGFGATLTAPAIAGLVLGIGMAVDTNVIIFERIKEELTKGKGYSGAVNDGYRRSLAPVLDGHITSFLTAAILYYFGLGPVRGFATTQMIALALSLFCGILISRLITEWYTKKNRHFEYFTPISRKIFKHAAFKFIEYRKIAYMISGVILILGVASFFNGFDEGVEFSGGRSYTVQFPVTQDVEKIRDQLKETFNQESPVIKTVGSKSKLNITTSYKIHETGNRVDSAVEQTLYTGLKPFLGNNVSYEEFKSPKYLQSSQTVLPTISDDLKRGAQYATIFALLIICLYIFIRFRDWRYSLGTIVALLHDVFVTLIVFSFLRYVVNFPLEIDQHFIAAILTVIGFSMNDTVIVYDRIREDSRLYPTMDKKTLVNRAINETLARTVMTSVTVFLTVLILYIVGGEVTRGFAFAMLIGVVTGTYSSIFVAAPILVDFAKNKPLRKPESKKV
jgi:SecD/SecF fusion protein